MEQIINVKNIIGANFTCQDAILLKKLLNFNSDGTIILDFNDLSIIPTTFFYTLLSDAIYEKGRNYVFEHLKVKNLSNINDFKMVVLGDSQILC